MRAILSALFLGGASAAFAQLVRQPNSTLVLPDTLPNSTGYTTENALGTLTFAFPIDTAVPPGVTDRLFVVERNNGIQMVNLTTLAKSTFLNLSSFLTNQGTPLATNGENGFLSAAFHPQYQQNGYVFVFHSLRIPSGGQLYQARGTLHGERHAGELQRGHEHQYRDLPAADHATRPGEQSQRR